MYRKLDTGRPANLRKRVGQKRRKREWRVLTDREWSRRCAIGAGIIRGRLAKKIATQIMADIVTQAGVAGDDCVGHADGGRIREIVKRVLVEEGF